MDSVDIQCSSVQAEGKAIPAGANGAGSDCVGVIAVALFF